MTDKTKQLIKRATGKQSVGGAAVIISAAYLISRLLGLFRDRLLVAHFGVGPQLDAYNAAFRLPDLLFTLLISGAFAVSFIPVLSEYVHNDDREMGWRVTSSLFNILMLGTALGAVILMILAGPLTTIITPGFDAERHKLTVDLTRIMLVTPILFAISSVFGSIQQAFNRFLFFALAGIFYNFGIIVGVIWLAPGHGVYGVAWGVIAGVAIQAVVQGFGLYGLGYRYTPSINFKLKGVKQTLVLMLPRSLDAGIDQINYVVETIIGSTLAQGSITAFTLANNLKNVPLVLISSSISTAVFPRLAARAARGDRTELIDGYVTTARLILFLAIPSAVLSIIARGYIVRLLYGFGSQVTADTLGWFAGSIVFAGLFMLVSRVYFAMQDTRTPLYVSLASIPLNIALSFVFAHKFGVAGLAMSASLVAFLETLALILILRRREGGFGELRLLKAIVPMLLAGGAMAGATYLAVLYLVPLYAADKGFSVLAPKFGLLMLIGTTVYLGACHVLRLDEVSAMLGRLRDAMNRSTELK
jgi:putative peptidoglycan lipid II flippase